MLANLEFTKEIILVALYFFFSHAWTALASTPIDPLLGVRISFFATQNLLAAMPLPSLVGKSAHALNLQAGYETAKVGGTGAALGSSYSGSFKGESAGLGFTKGGSSGWGYYIFAAGSKLSGKSTLGDSIATTTLSDFQNTAFVTSTGVSIPLFGSKNSSPIAMGLLAGPALTKINSSFHISSNLASNVYDYSSSPTNYGALSGAQISVKLGKIFINPYIFYFHEFSKRCKKYDTTDAQDDGSFFDYACYKSDGPRHIGILGNFTAYGANFGYDGFIINIYSQVVKNSQMQSITFNNYALDYSFDF